MPVNSGESLEEFELHNLREYEFARVGVAREAWEAAVAEQANTLPSVNPTATHALQALIAAASSDVERFKLRLPEAKLPESANETPRIDRIIGGQNRVLVLHTKQSDLTFIIPPGVSERDWLMQETLKAKSEAAGLYERAQQLMARAGHAHVAADLCDASEAGPSDSASAPSPRM